MGAVNVGDDFPREVERCRDLVKRYQEIGPSGAFGAAAISQAITVAEAAWASGDVVKIVQAYAVLRGCE